MSLEKTICLVRRLIIVIINEQVKNLRSQVSRSGICCLGDMYTTLGKNMDNVSYKLVCCADGKNN